MPSFTLQFSSDKWFEHLSQTHLPLLYLPGVFRAFAQFKWILCFLTVELYEFLFFKYTMLVCPVPDVYLESIYYVSLKICVNLCSVCMDVYMPRHRCEGQRKTVGASSPLPPDGSQGSAQALRHGTACLYLQSQLPLHSSQCPSQSRRF